MLIQRRQRGFNLTEAMVTLAVLGVLMAAALPQLGDWLRATQVRGTAETLVSGLQRARMEAMKRNAPVTLWLVSPNASGALDNTCALSSTSGAWIVSLENPAGKCAADTSATTAPRIVDRYTPGGGGTTVTVAATDADAKAATSVRFNGFGQIDRSVTGALARIDVSHESGGRQLRVELSASGGVRMCDKGVTDATDPRKCRA